jgi:hypothetical protein
MEKITQNKKFFLVMGVLIVFVGAAAFVTGRLLTSEVGPLGPIGIGGNADVITVIPAEELPTTLPEVVGEFVERKDNTIIVQPVPLKVRGGGIAARSPADMNSVPRIEVVITSETTIYQDTASELNGPPLSEGQSLQQTVEESTLDGLNSESTITVWGRKSGDRIIAEVLMYSNIVMIKRQLFEDCETCP